MTTTALGPLPTRPSSSGTSPKRRATRGKYVGDWIEKHCVFTNGEWVGRPFRLLSWQWAYLYAMFEVDPVTRLRLKRWGYTQIGKKNGKTEFSAALALYFLLGDGEPAPLVVCAASSDEQADLVYGAAKLMCELSPTLSQVTQTFDKEILVPSSPGAKLQRVSSNSGTLDGKNIHAAILDELHEWLGAKGQRLWDVITNGTGARRQPFIQQITTAGYDQESICYRQYEYAKRVLSGEIDDPAFFAYVVEAPDGCDLLDEEALKAANPSYGVTVHNSFYVDQVTKKTEATYRRYFLNQWVESEEIWEVAQIWDDLEDSSFQLDPALPTCVGIDVSLRRDATAVVAAQVQETDKGKRVVLRSKVWENPYPESDARHSTWKVELPLVMQHLQDLYAQYPVGTREIDEALIAGPAFFYDPHYFRLPASVLSSQGLCMVEYPQTDARMIPASQEFFETAQSGVLAHDGDPTLRRHVRNVTADEKPRGWRITKPKGSRRHIDAAVSAAIAAYEAQRSIEMSDTDSVYEEHDLLVLG